MTPAEARSQLMATADKVSAMNGAAFDQDFGAGRLNLPNLIK